MTWPTLLTLLILLAAFALLWPLSLLFGYLADRYHAWRERDLDDRILAELRSRILHGTSATWSDR